MLAILTTPALSIAIVVGALWQSPGGFWPAAPRPRPTVALVQGVAVAITVFVLAQRVFSAAPLEE